MKFKCRMAIEECRGEKTLKLYYKRSDKITFRWSEKEIIQSTLYSRVHNIDRIGEMMKYMNRPVKEIMEDVKKIISTIHQEEAEKEAIRREWKDFKDKVSATQFEIEI